MKFSLRRYEACSDLSEAPNSADISLYFSQAMLVKRKVQGIRNEVVSVLIHRNA